MLALTLIACSGQSPPTVTSPPAAPATPEPSPTPTDTPWPAPPLRFLALGDSYTIGESVAESERWPVQLTRRLQDEGYDLDAPRIVARTGWTTGELLDAIARVAPQGRYDLVSLLIGVNNQFEGAA